VVSTAEDVSLTSELVWIRWCALFGIVTAVGVSLDVAMLLGERFICRDKQSEKTD
jgi:hypothetical protein